MSPPYTCCPLSLTPRKTSIIISAITSIGRGSTREGVKATPSETKLVGCHHIFIIARRLTRAVRKNGKCTRSGPPSRRRSTFWKGSGEAEVHFPSLLQIIQSLDKCQTTKLGQLAGESDKHYGERCASPERQFVCEGWCRNTIPKRTTLDHPDVVCRIFQPSPYPFAFTPLVLVGVHLVFQRRANFLGRKYPQRRQYLYDSSALIPSISCHLIITHSPSYSS